MKFKFKNTLLVSFLAIAGILGVSSALINKQVNQEPVAEKAEAESYYNTIEVYFVPHDQWVSLGNERFKMNVYNGGNYLTNVEMTLYGTSTVPGPYYGRKVYRATCTWDPWPSRVQIARMSSNYGTQYNCSGQIYLTHSYEIIYNDSGMDYWDNWTGSTSGVSQYGSFSNKAIYKTTDQSPSSSTGRVFFYNSGTDWAAQNGCAVYAWGGDASPKMWTGKDFSIEATIYNLTWFTDDNGESYGYADIPTNVTGYKFAAINKVDDYGASTVYLSTTQLSPDSFAYVRYGLNDKSISTGGAHNDVAGANLMKKVIQAYNTCNSSVLNGYGAYSALNTNFYSHATDAAKSATETSLGGLSKSIEAHFEGMASRSSNSNNRLINLDFTLFGVDESNLSTIIIIVASSVALLSVTALSVLVIKKRKNKEE